MIRRVPELDGWRAISIVSVIAAHMLPLGPKAWRLNEAAGSTGMALFFLLSGFLMTSILLSGSSVRAFLVRRAMRIIPLAWLWLLLVLGLHHAGGTEWIANVLFVANLPPFYLEHTGHFWSLCLEMQFYGALALLVATLGRKGLYLLVPLCFLVTAGRILHGETISIVTWYRCDEILAGCCLALLAQHELLPTNKRLARFAPLILAPLLLASGHPGLPWLNYARPYLAAMLIGATMIDALPWIKRALVNPVSRYIADISFALYVVHPYTAYGWLGAGDPIVRYAKRPLSFALMLALAHLSTFYYEAWWRKQARRWAAD